VQYCVIRWRATCSSDQCGLSPFRVDAVTTGQPAVSVG